MITVNTLAELKSAIEEKEPHIIVRGEAATAIRAKIKKRKAIKGAGIGLLIAGLAAAPFTAGTSLLPAAGFTAVAGAALSISAGELACLIGGSLAFLGFLKGMM